MNYTKRALIAVLFIWTACFGGFWNRSDNRVINQVVPDPESMNQNLTVNLNYSPTQIKTPLIFPDKFFSNLPIKEWQTKTSSFLYNKRYFIGGSVVLGGYVLTCNYCVQANKYLERTDTWASWRPDTPVELLIAIPQQELAKELILEIQRRYSNPQNPTDFISPLIAFVQTIDEEIIKIKQYAQVYGWITRLHIQVIFPINQKQFNLLGEKYKKLIYLKNIFLSWAAEYKVSHNKNRRFMPAYTIQSA